MYFSIPLPNLCYVRISITAIPKPSKHFWWTFNGGKWLFLNVHFELWVSVFSFAVAPLSAHGDIRSKPDACWKVNLFVYLGHYPENCTCSAWFGLFQEIRHTTPYFECQIVFETWWTLRNGCDAVLKFAIPRRKKNPPGFAQLTF